MKNRIKDILYILIAIVISVVGIATVSAKTGEKFTLDKKTYINLVGSRKEAKFHTTMGYAWCITPHLKGADEGTTFTYSKEETDGGFGYIMEKLDNSDRNYLVKTLAIWLYLENFMPDTYWDHTGNQIVKDARALANEAKNHKDWNASPTISLSNPSKAMSLVKEGNTYYYVSGNLSAKTTKATTYTVSLSNAPSGTKIVNANNEEAKTFKSGETFKIKVPEANAKSVANMKVTVSATGTRKFIERYKPSNSSKQDLIVVRSENKTVTAASELTITPEKRVCEIFNGTYYGEDGSIVDKETYNKQCNHVCEVYKGKYYGEDGKETTEEKYKEQCEHVCEVYKGKYYGEDGKETTKEKYKQQCEHVCEVYKGKYYGEDGKETTKEKYKQQCEHVCEVYKGKYYGEDGKETTEEKYKQQCEHVCEVYKGKYYGEDGKETTKEEYTKQCSHVCEVYKGKYYGEDGKETTEEKYKEQCEHVCEVYKGKYFDSLGKETTLEEYRRQCMHFCEIYDGKYYGKDGNEVDSTTYDNECNPSTVIVPPTGSNKMPIGMYLLMGILPIVGGTKLILKTKKEN